MGKLFAVVVAIIALVSAALFASHIWWLPVDISAHGHAIDRQLSETMVTSGALFVLSQLALAVFAWRYGDRRDGRQVKTFPGGATPMVVFATVLVGAEVLALTFVGSKVWAGIYQTAPDPNSLQIDVQAEQFAFYFRYPGADRTFGAVHPERIDEASGNFFGLDHRVVRTQYPDLALVAVCTGMVLSWLMRLHLAWPETPIPGLEKLSPNGAAGGVITPEYYLSLMTMHGTIMVFFVLTTAPFAGFGNYFLPIQVGAEDMAFPRINMTSFWVTLVAFLVLVAAFFVGDGPPLSGWTAYAPLSAVGKDAGPGQGVGQTLWAVSITLFCVAQLLGALNFITTTLDLRTKGMSLARMPYSTWAWFITSVIGLIAFAVLMPACILLILDRVAGTSFFLPARLVISDRLQPHAC